MRALATLVVVAFAGNIAEPTLAQTTDGVVARCGASSGYSFFFKDDLWNPSGSGWDTDGISSGKIILVKLGDEWDIQFDDVVGANSYRGDGASVIPLLEKTGMLTVGAFAAAYADIYTFDLANRTVAWTSSKIGPLAPKVAAYVASCD